MGCSVPLRTFAFDSNEPLLKTVSRYRTNLGSLRDKNSLLTVSFPYGFGYSNPNSLRINVDVLATMKASGNAEEKHKN